MAENLEQFHIEITHMHVIRKHYDIAEVAALAREIMQGALKTLAKHLETEQTNKL